MAEIPDDNNNNNGDTDEIVIDPQSPKNDKNDNNHKTSTITSTEQLICKSPQQSHRSSCNNTIKPKQCDNPNKSNSDYNNYLIYTGLFQVLFGVLMMIFGVLTIINRASLSQIGGGIWGGGLTTVTGVVGLLAAARDWCPLKTTAQKITHTIYLALTLICLASAQLIVAISAIGLGRDFNNLVYAIVDREQADDSILTATPTPVPSGTIYITLPVNYPILLYNIALVIVASLECLVATITSYKSSKLLCPCFRQHPPSGLRQDDSAYRQAFVNNWLGKHNPPPQLFVVAAAPPPSTLTKNSKLEFPLFTLPPPPPPPPLLTYPLIPAPLGTIPSPIIPPPPPPSKRELLYQQRKYLAKLHAGPYYRRSSKSDISTSSRSKSNQKNDKLSDLEVVKTYTGLDKAIAEEFIDICDSRHNSLCSDSSCTCSSTNATHSDMSSGDYLVTNKV